MERGSCCRRTATSLAVVAVLVSSLNGQGPSTHTPDKVASGYYEFLFRHVTFLKTKADEKVAKGQVQTQLRQTYKVAAGLTDSETTALENASLQCSATLDTIFSDARQLVSAGRPNTPAGVVALKSLQQQRVQAVLACRDRLHQTFGEQRFTQFELFLLNWMTSRHLQTQPIRPAAPNSAGAGDSREGGTK